MASRRVNNLIDQLDREVTPYIIRARVVAEQVDVEPSNNVASKSFFTATRVFGDAEHRRDVYFTNTTDSAIKFRLSVTATTLPEDWSFSMSPAEGSSHELAPGESLQVRLTLTTPDVVHEAEHFDVVVSALDDDRNVLLQDEWFAAVDSRPPTLSSVEITYDPATNMIVSEVAAEDLNSGILEASGVKLEFTTTEEIFAVTVKAHNYNFGNFLTETTFTSRVGPFEGGTRVLARVGIIDTVGNPAYSDVTVIEVPSDARSSKSPPPPVSPFVESGGDIFVPTFSDSVPGDTTARADIVHLGAEVTAPRSAAVGEVFTFDVAATVRNDGPHGPVNVVWLKRLTVPDGCRSSQTVFQEVVPGLHVGQSLTRDLTEMRPEVVCSEPDIYRFTFVDQYSIDAADITDTDLENNVVEGAFEIEVR